MKYFLAIEFDSSVYMDI